MVEVEKELFDSFRKIHDEYALNPDKLQDQFNKEGEKVIDKIREWESKLCLQSEKGGYGSFTSKLSEKFWEEIRKNFPQIDSVGLIVEESIPASSTPDGFSLKKINL